MTATEMKSLLFLKFDSLYEAGAPAYDDDQIYPILSNAQRRIVRRIADGVDYNERTKKLISNLYKTCKLGTDTTDVVSVTVTDYFPNGNVYKLPEGLWYELGEYAVDNSDTRINIKPKTFDFYYANVKNPYQKPDSTSAWRFERDDSEDTIPRKQIEIVTDGTTISDYRIRYMSEIQDIDESNDCTLHEDLHDDIVDEAYKIITGAVEPEKYQIATNESLNK